MSRVSLVGKPVSTDVSERERGATDASLPLFASHTPSPKGRPHRRGRGHSGTSKKHNSIRHHKNAHKSETLTSSPEAAAEATPAMCMVNKTAPAPVDFTSCGTPAPSQQEPSYRAPRQTRKGPRSGWSELHGSTNVAAGFVGATAAPSVSPAVASSPAFKAPAHVAPTAPPPLPFLAVRLPAWCRSASPAAYPLSEDGLTNELVDLFAYLELTPAERAARAQLLRCVENSVEDLFRKGTATPAEAPDAQVALYGSYALGLSLPSSDIDLVLTFPAEEAEVRRKAVETCKKLQQAQHRHKGSAVELLDSRATEAAKVRQVRHLERLHNLADHLRRASSLSSSSLQVEVYDQCRVPRIHLRGTTPAAAVSASNSSHGVSCDINSSLTAERVARVVARQQRWLADTPLAAFLIRVTKAAAKQWDMNEVFAGGLASTALYCLVLRFLAQLELLRRHAKLAEENMSPPRYDDATRRSSTSPSLSLSASTSCVSPTSPLGSSMSAVALPTSAMAESIQKANAVAAIPPYLPTWAVKRKTYTTVPQPPADSAAPGKTESVVDGVYAHPASASPASARPHGCSVSWWGSSSHSGSRQSHSSRSSTCNDKDEDEGEDEEADAFTQEALTRASCVSTTTTTPRHTSPQSCASGTSESRNVSLYEKEAEHDPETNNGLHNSKDGTASAHSFPSAEELARVAQARYGASPARLLLKLWRFLSADVFLSGYQVADVFGDDAVWAPCECGVAAGQAPSLPSIDVLERATYANRAGFDLSAPAFRLPDLLALFRCTSAALENMLRFQRYPRRVAPTMLSTIFVDPRAACA